MDPRRRHLTRPEKAFTDADGLNRMRLELEDMIAAAGGGSFSGAYTDLTGVPTGTVFYRKTAGTGNAETQSLATLKTDLGLSGSNTGDQFTNVTSSRLLGRYTAGFGAAEEISLGTGISVAGGTLNVTRLRVVAFQVVTTVPMASEILCLFPCVDAFTIPANMAGSVGSVITNPTATFDIDVQRQVGGSGAFSTIGTISVSTGGTITFTTSSGTSKSIAAGDILKFVADSTGDASFIGAFSIKGDIG